MNFNSYCKQKVANKGSALYYSILFLPKNIRYSIITIYAFLKELNEIIFKNRNYFSAKNQFDWWRIQLDNIFKRKSKHPIVRGLSSNLLYKIDNNEMLSKLFEIINEFELDMKKKIYLDYSSLHRYFYNTYGIIGEISLNILGYKDLNTVFYIKKITLVLKMIEYIINIRCYALLGKIYIPFKDIEYFNFNVKDIINCNYSENFFNLIEFQYKKIHSFYREAMKILPNKDKRSLNMTLSMAAIYYEILKKSEKNKWKILNTKVSLTPMQKFLISKNIYFSKN